MNIPFSGFMYEPGNSGPIHSHRIYITSWDGRPAHVHEYKGVTSFDDGHSHQYAGTTEPAPSGVPHTHRYFTFTSVDDRHRHRIGGITGPAIPLQNGGHYHEFMGYTTVDDGHRHTYRGITSR